MTIHLNERQIEDYRRRSLSPGELLAVDDHLATCPECRLRLAEGEQLWEAFAAWDGLRGEPRHAVGLDLGALMDEAGQRRGRWGPRSWPWVLAAAVLIVAGLAYWLVTLRRDVDSLRSEVRRIETRKPPSLTRPPEIAELLSEGAVLRGAAAAPEFFLSSPFATAVLDGRPTFRWKPLPGAESYRVMVFDRNFHRLADSGPLSQVEWRPAHALPAGAVYAWQVKAKRRGGELTAPGSGSPQTLFRVLAADRAAEIEREAQAHKGSHLALGILYARAGLLDDAERELDAAVRESPESEQPRDLLATVRSWRPQSPSPTRTNAAQ